MNNGGGGHWSNHYTNKDVTTAEIGTQEKEKETRRARPSLGAGEGAVKTS